MSNDRSLVFIQRVIIHGSAVLVLLHIHVVNDISNAISILVMYLFYCVFSHYICFNMPIITDNHVLSSPANYTCCTVIDDF